MEKQCFKCGDVKPLDAFYKHPMMPDGHLNKCAECTKSDARANRAARIEYYRAYDRMRAKEPHRVKERVERAKAHPRPRPEPDPVKRAARIALGNAVRDGLVKKPPECEVCAVCDDSLHGHHEDYSKPLEVIWVCTACHAFIHAYWRAAERMAA
jgi:hypothetical protein